MSTIPDLAALESRCRHHVQALAQTPRAPGSSAHRRAADYIRYHLEQAGFIVLEEPFEVVGLVGNNLLTQPLPDPPSLPLLVVGAHYDSRPDTPGADDNASAVAALLELAALLSPQLQQGSPLSCRVQLVAYDLEESNLVGSFVHSRALQKARTSLRGMISLEMLGYTDQRPGSQRLPPTLAKLYPNVANFIGICGNDASLGLLQIVTQSMKKIPGLPVECLAVPGKGEMLPEVRLSDHSSFWDRDYQALMITDTSFFRNPHYHQTSDTPQTLDYPFLAKVTAGVAEAIQCLLR
jgi:hypothetical protein